MIGQIGPMGLKEEGLKKTKTKTKTKKTFLRFKVLPGVAPGVPTSTYDTALDVQ